MRSLTTWSCYKRIFISFSLFFREKENIYIYIYTYHVFFGWFLIIKHGDKNSIGLKRILYASEPCVFSILISFQFAVTIAFRKWKQREVFIVTMELIFYYSKLERIILECISYFQVRFIDIKSIYINYSLFQRMLLQIQILLYRTLQYFKLIESIYSKSLV